MFNLSPSKFKCFLLLFLSYSCVLKPSLLLLGFIKMHWVRFSPPKRYATLLLFLVWPPVTKPIIWLNLRLGSVPAPIPPKSSGGAQSPPQQPPRMPHLKHHQHGQFALCCGWISQKSPRHVSSWGTWMSCQRAAAVSPSPGPNEADLGPFGSLVVLGDVHRVLCWAGVARLCRALQEGDNSLFPSALNRNSTWRAPAPESWISGLG